VLAQDYPRLEVLVIDGLSTDHTLREIETIADARVRVISNPGRIQSCALNIGIRAAQGEIIARVDGHTLIAPDYMSRCVVHLQTTGAANVGGLLRFVGLTPMGKAIAAAYRSPFAVPSRFHTSAQAGYVDTVYLGAWPRKIFEQIGLFDETLVANEDYELNYRIRRSGGRIYLAPDIHSEYYGRQTLSALWQQFFRYGGWKLNVLIKHPASVRLRHLVAPVFVAALIGGAVLAPLSERVHWLWRLVVISYGLANAAVSIRQKCIRLPFVFLCIHFAWGLGFWSEALKRVYGRLT
jgi:glycosyltransferase involved in cell wall biosynthesis